MSIDVIEFRKKAVSALPKQRGVYVLCDLDGSPIYVGKSEDGIRSRVRRHLTSARSDIIANRMVDIWEVAFVWAIPSEGDLDHLEAVTFHSLDDEGDITLFNGDVPSRPLSMQANKPEPVIVKVLPDEIIAQRKVGAMRVARQAAHYAALLDVYLNVKRDEHIARALDGHFSRLRAYHDSLRPEPKGW